MPLTSDASANISELAHAHPEWSQARRVAAGLNAARRAGKKSKGAATPMKPRELMGNGKPKSESKTGKWKGD